MATTTTMTTTLGSVKLCPPTTSAAAMFRWAVPNPSTGRVAAAGQDGAGSEHREHVAEVDHHKQHHHGDQTEAGEPVAPGFDGRGDAGKFGVDCERNGQGQQHQHDQGAGDLAGVDRDAGQQHR